ncbi:MAG TPA: hypothetical protein VFK86_14050, partial [Bauldia sp.]|nr:hypothetical protein [Bauldia sp.]
MEVRWTEWFFLGASAFLVLGAFSFQLAGIDPSMPVFREDTSARGGSMTMQLLLGVIYSGSGFLLLRSDNIIALLRRT